MHTYKKRSYSRAMLGMATYLLLGLLPDVWYGCLDSNRPRRTPAFLLPKLTQNGFLICDSKLTL